MVILDALDDIVGKEHRINMKDTHANTQMENFFDYYHSLIFRHGLKWNLSENQNVALSNVLSNIRTIALQDRLRSDLNFSHHKLRKNFRLFMKHEIALAEAFQLVDNCKPVGLIEEYNRLNASSTGNIDKADSIILIVRWVL